MFYLYWDNSGKIRLANWRTESFKDKSSSIAQQELNIGWKCLPSNTNDRKNNMNNITGTTTTGKELNSKENNNKTNKKSNNQPNPSLVSLTER